MTERKMPTDRKTAGQIGSRSSLSAGSSAWSLLPAANKAQWNAWAAKSKRRDPVTGKMYSLTGRVAFIGLASKFMQARPGANVPINPPVTRFAGDVISVTALATTGKITFTASAANAAGVLTELLVQRLPSADRAPQLDDYRSATFQTFVAATLTKDVTLTPGIWACAYRFVSVNTGEEKGIIPITTLTVALSLEDGGLGEDEEAAQAA